MPLTIRRLLHSPTLHRSRPHILSGGPRLDDPVRGIHIAESADLAGLIEGGELILCSGLALTDSVEHSSSFLADLRRSGACGVVFSFLSDDTVAKSALRAAAAPMDFPVILLDDRARFIEIIGAYNESSRSASAATGPVAVAEFLSSPVAEQLSAVDLLLTAAELLNTPLVLEDELSVVLFQRGLGIEQMYQYSELSRRARGPEAGGFELAGEQWVQNPVFVDGRRAGRLLCPLRREPAGFAVVLDQLSRILGGKLAGNPEQLQLLRQELLADVIGEMRSNQNLTEKVAALRLRLFGVDGYSELVPAVLCIPEGPAGGSDPASLVRRLRGAFGKLPVPVIVRRGADQESDAIGMMFFVPGSGQAEAVLRKAYQLVAAECGPSRWSMGVADSCGTLKQASVEGLQDAYRVARGALSTATRQPRYYRAHDLGFRWILQSLVAAPEGAAFVQDQLGQLAQEPELLEFVEAYLESTGNIAELSRMIHLSRPSIYARIRRLQEGFGLDMENADTRTSLHLALTLYRLAGA
ncbi:PucR family transcriptional regulator [Glutamicibacter sp. NPDC087673]|uniref:PucR family transcriptional regulator n=1 Tax=Glutamicibacter sp. NPDC087673 TaxID=3363997 RepID=UPI00381AB174